MLLILGIIEKRKNERNLKEIPIRINVNGIRGKSTITRFITYILIEAGYRTLGKTTGTAARMIYWDKDKEEEIVRTALGPRISEQIKVIDRAASIGAEALVCECMAVQPDLQDVYSNNMIKSTLTVIVNVLEDHLDVMGPTTDEIALAFSKTIPYNGLLVIPDCEYTDFFVQVAEERNTEVFIADESEIPEGFTDLFEYKVFPNNCSMALAVARALGIDKEIALQGMLNANPDPGAAVIHTLKDGNKTAHFINGFAANEPSSSLEIWDEFVGGIGRNESPIILLNCRPDRIDRTRQFVQDFIPHIKNAILVVIGERTSMVTKAYQRGDFPNVVEYYNLEDCDCDEVMDFLLPEMWGRTTLGVGNIHGMGFPLIERLEEYYVDPKKKKVQPKFEIEEDGGDVEFTRISHSFDNEAETDFSESPETVKQ